VFAQCLLVFVVFASVCAVFSIAKNFRVRILWTPLFSLDMSRFFPVSLSPKELSIDKYCTSSHSSFGIMKFYLLSTILLAAGTNVCGTKTTPYAPAVAATDSDSKSKSSSKSRKSAPHSYKELYDALLMEYEKQTFVVSRLREILADAQLKLQAAEPVSPPFQINCTVLCSGLGFAPGCVIAPVNAFYNTSETLCKRASPMGLGLLNSPLGGACCQYNATEGPCELVGPGAENSCHPCSDWYTPELNGVELFLPLNREWDDTTKTCTETEI